jgi:hypothetical protein
MDISDIIAVADEHYPAAGKEALAEIAHIKQGWRKTQFLQSPQNCFG